MKGKIMLLDTQNLFSDAQAITATAASNNVVRFGLGDISFVPLLIQVVEDFATLTSLTVKVQTAVDSAFTTPVDLASVTIAAADLKAGTILPINYIPKGNLGYMRLYYTVTGSNATAGKITAGVTAGIDIRY